MRNTLSPAGVPALLAAVAVLAAPALARASCYSIYDTQNRMVLQSTVAPIDLSKHISTAMHTRFPGYFFVMVPDDSDCHEVRTGITVSPRFDSSKPGATSAPNELLEASPLMRAATPAGSAIGARTSGTTLNVRRP